MISLICLRNQMYESIVGSASQKWNRFQISPEAIRQFMPENYYAWKIHLFLN